MIIRIRYGSAMSADRDERCSIKIARNLPDHDVLRIAELHHQWKLDSEIGETMGLTSLTVWHARTMRGINRHGSAIGA